MLVFLNFFISLLRSDIPPVSGVPVLLLLPAAWLRHDFLHGDDVKHCKCIAVCTHVRIADGPYAFLISADQHFFQHFCLVSEDWQTEYAIRCQTRDSSRTQKEASVSGKPLFSSQSHNFDYNSTYSSISASATFNPSGRLASSIHSSRVCASAPRTVPTVFALIPSDSGTLLSVE